MLRFSHDCFIVLGMLRRKFLRSCPVLFLILVSLGFAQLIEAAETRPNILLQVS